MGRNEVRVPDLGDFADVPVVEVHVKPGAIIALDDSLITLESEKASFDVPAPAAGKVVEVLVSVGDRVNQGTPIAIVETGSPAQESPENAEKREHTVPETQPPTPLATAKNFEGTPDQTCQVLVLGAGPGGYSAAFRAADLGMSTILVDRWPVLGGVCLNVGCIPSKALLHTAAIIDAAKSMASHGVTFAAPNIDLAKLRAHKEAVVRKLTNGLAAMAKMRQVRTIEGTGSFLDAHHLAVSGKDGGRQVIRFEKAIIAAGSESATLPFLPDDPRIVDSTGALELSRIPEKMLVIGGGIIGLEMATVYSTLGARLDVVEVLHGLMLGADRDLVQVWQKANAWRFDKILLGTKVIAAEAKQDGIHVRFQVGNAPEEGECYDMVLVAIGRKPNGRLIGAEKAGVEISARGFIPTDRAMRTNVPHIFAIGDIASEPMLAHKAVHEGHVAAENAAGKESAFDARQIPSVAYTDPEIAWAGITETEAKARGIVYRKSVFPWSASGRAIANGRDEGFTKLLFEEDSHRVIGGAVVGTEAGSLISEVCLAIEMGADATDIGKTIHPHPTLSESIGMAAEAFEGICTDLPPTKSARA